MTFNPKAVRAQREEMLLRLLFRTTQVMNAEMARRVRARGYEGFQPSFTALLANVDTEGTRIGALARKMGTSRQAASQLLREIEKHGLVERQPDPADRRGIIIRHTPSGRQILLDAMEVMLAIESEYESVLGADGLGRLKKLLKRLVEEVDPAGRLGLE